MQRYDLNSIVFGIKEHTDIIPTNVFEVGSRDGIDAHILAQNFNLPNSACYVFEPNPICAEQIMKSYPTMHLFNNAISDKEGVLPFFVEPENVGASSLYSKDKPTEGIKEITVECQRMDMVIQTLGIETIDVMKLDVEGHTLECLKSFGNELGRLQSLQIECEHQEVWKGQALFPEVSQWLIDHGYIMEMFTLLRCAQSDSFWVKRNRLLV